MYSKVSNKNYELERAIQNAYAFFRACFLSFCLFTTFAANIADLDRLFLNNFLLIGCYRRYNIKGIDSTLKICLNLNNYVCFYY